MQALRDSRPRFKGAITKISTKLDDLNSNDAAAIARIDRTFITGQLNSIERTEKRFNKNLEETQEYAPADDDELDTFQDEEDASADSFEQVILKAREQANHLLALKNVQEGMADLTLNTETLEASLSARPDDNHSDSYSDVASQFTLLNKEWRDARIRRDHPLKKELEAFTGRLHYLAADIASAKTRSSPSVPVPSVVVPKPEKNLTKLPAIDLPTFSGDVLAWPTFWNQFVATIDSNPDLPDSTKLSYLRRSIKDPNAAVIMNPSIDGPDTYPRLKKELHLRYQRTKKIHRDLVNKLINLPAAKNNSSELRKLLDSATNCVECLQTTGYFSLDAILSSIIYSKLPYKVQTDWDDDQPDDNKILPFEELRKYVKKKAFTLSDHESSQKPQPAAVKETNPTKRKDAAPANKGRHNVHVASAAPAPHTIQKVCFYDCKLCPGVKHFLYHCPKWTTLSLAQKTAHVGTYRLCSNCLGGHATGDCKSKSRCYECRQKHHTSLHQAQPAPPVTTFSSTQMKDGLLSTAQVMLHGPNGKSIQARALIDSGASISMITTRSARLLDLPLAPVNVRLAVARGGVTKPIKNKTSLTVTPLEDTTLKMSCYAAVSKEVAGIMPTQVLPDVSELPHLIGLPLADSTYNIPGVIDIILGTDMFAKIVPKNVPTRTGNEDEPVAQPTVFGWTLSGLVPGITTSFSSATTYCLAPTNQTNPIPPIEPTLESLLDAILHEDEGPKDEVTEPENHVEKHYLETFSYSADRQRYEVTLPKKQSIRTLGESRPQAVSRFLQTTRAARKKGIQSSMHEGIKSYIDLGHAEAVPPDEPTPPLAFWLPMHAVMKESSTSTKLRVVFDGSAATSTGLSLNQALHAGPTIQATLSDTLMKFRTYPIALNADISKMYREVELCKADRDLHRFVWREDAASPLTDFRMTRVTFGVSASPFLAIRTLHQTAVDHGEGYPEATWHIKSSFYVDDFLGGANSSEEAIQLFHQMREVLKKGGFDLRKWRSSSTDVLDHIPTDLLESNPVKTSTADNLITHSKALGLHWDSSLDEMSPAISTATLPSSTKRGLVSAIFRTYDVLGWMSPTTLKMKILIQGLWKMEKGWDDPAPEAAVNAYLKWREELKILAAKTLPRRYTQSNPTSITLHGFGDASKAAYGAVIYCRATYADQPPTISLVTSKTKLVKQVTKKPKKKKEEETEDDTTNEAEVEQTIPRLELCAALLLAKLLSKTGAVLEIDSSKWQAWSDSSTILAWLDGHTRSHPIFVSNRIRQILELTKPSHWLYVPTADNPADCASRGVSPTELFNLSLWWEGPPWLKLEPIPVPKQPPRKPLPDARPPVNVINVSHSVAEELCQLPLRYPHIIAVAAWCLRFTTRVKQGRPQPDTRTKRLLGTERMEAERWMLKEAQQRSFPKDFRRLEAGKELARDSRLKFLTPVFDQHQLLRLKGRIGKSSRPSTLSHPIICDSQDQLMVKYFEYLHILLCHCGPSTLLASTSAKLHVLGARRLSRRICNRCITCRICRPRTGMQQMADLPAPRVNASPPFTHCGMDYAGSFTIKMGYVRKPTLLDAYVCVFVCLSTKAVHLEVVSDESTPAFLAALQRFIARRGCPQHFYSDNGGNFVGARNQCKRLYTLLRNQTEDEDVRQFLDTHHQIQWHNIPAYSPHMGGLWEAAVKGMKAHLKRVMGVIRFTFEELTTIICRIEACMNSRPLLPITSHCPDGSSILTSGHFLTNKSPSLYPEDPEPLTNLQLLQKWQLCDGVVQQFWTRWSKEYLNSLQARTKWQATSPNLQVDDVVAIKPMSKFLPCHWPLGRVHRLLPGTDGRVRVVELQVRGGYTQRSVARLALIYRPGEDESSPPGNLSRQGAPDDEEPA